MCGAQVAGEMIVDVAPVKFLAKSGRIEYSLMVVFVLQPAVCIRNSKSCLSPAILLLGNTVERNVLNLNHPIRHFGDVLG